MNFADLKGMTVDDLRLRLGELREQLFLSRMKNSMGQLASPIEIRKARRDLARVLTAIRQHGEQK